MSSAEMQARLWREGAREWAELQEFHVLPMYEGAIAAVAPLSGKKLLDAGCGAGLALQVAARSGAEVYGVDATAELLAIAKERTPHAELSVCDIESIPFADRTFDVTTSFNAVQYTSDPMKALRELARVTKSGGAVVIGQWGEMARCETEGFFKALRAIAPPPHGSPAPLALSGDGVLERCLVEAGLRPLKWGEVEAPFVYADYETAWRAQMSAGPLRRVISIAGEDAVRDVFARIFGPATQPDGSVVQKNVFRWIVSGV